MDYKSELENWDHVGFSLSYFPRRWQMILLLASGITLSYTLRVNVSVAAVEMEESLNWSGTEKGLLFSAFYVGYAIGQLPSAFITHWYGAKFLFGISLFITSLLSIIFPLTIKYSYGLGIFLRILTGLSASATFPSCYYFYKSWIPIAEKTIMIPAVNSGVYLGEIICFSISGVLVKSKFSILGMNVGGWPATFWVFGLLGVVWFPFWLLLAYEKPEDNPSMHPDELKFIRIGGI